MLDRRHPLEEVEVVATEMVVVWAEEWVVQEDVDTTE